MNALATLARLRKERLDQWRQKLLELEQRRASIENGIAELAVRVRAEAEVVGRSPEFGAYYGRFVDGMNQRRLHFERERDRLDGEIGSVKEGTMAAFAELKRLEIAIANRERAAAVAAARKERRVLDELGGQRFDQRRRQAAGQGR